MKPNVQLKKNVNRNYLFTLLQNIDLTRGIWMLYLASKGMSLTQLGLLETVFHITSFTMEVPTGAVADIFGRKISRILGRVTSLISIVLMLKADSFLGFSISFIFSALSYNLESGAGDALVYDSLKEIGEEDQFMKIAGNKEMFYQGAGVISFLVGGYLATKSYHLTYMLTIVMGMAALIQATTFKEPSIGMIKREKQEGNIFIKQLKDSVAVIRNNPKIGFYIIFAQIIMAFCTCIAIYAQNFLKEGGYSEGKIGLVYAVSSLTVAFMVSQVYRIEKCLKEQGILTIIPILTAACILGVALSPYAYVFYVLLMINEGVIFITMSDYINKRIPSENRATILSFGSMVFSFFMITFFPLIGFMGDQYSLKVAFIGLGVVGCVLALFNCFIMVSRNRKGQEVVEDVR